MASSAAIGQKWHRFKHRKRIAGEGNERKHKSTLQRNSWCILTDFILCIVEEVLITSNVPIKVHCVEGTGASVVRGAFLDCQWRWTELSARSSFWSGHTTCCCSPTTFTLNVSCSSCRTFLTQCRVLLLPSPITSSTVPQRVLRVWGPRRLKPCPARQ